MKEKAAVYSTKIKELDTIAYLEARYGYERSDMAERTIGKVVPIDPRNLDGITQPFKTTRRAFDQPASIIEGSILDWNQNGLKGEMAQEKSAGIPGQARRGDHEEDFGCSNAFVYDQFCKQYMGCNRLFGKSVH